MKIYLIIWLLLKSNLKIQINSLLEDKKYIDLSLIYNSETILNNITNSNKTDSKLILRIFKLQEAINLKIKIVDFVKYSKKKWFFFLAKQDSNFYVVKINYLKSENKYIISYSNNINQNLCNKIINLKYKIVVICIDNENNIINYTASKENLNFEKNNLKDLTIDQEIKFLNFLNNYDYNIIIWNKLNLIKDFFRKTIDYTSIKKIIVNYNLKKIIYLTKTNKLYNCNITSSNQLETNCIIKDEEVLNFEFFSYRNNYYLGYLKKNSLYRCKNDSCYNYNFKKIKGYSFEPKLLIFSVYYLAFGVVNNNDKNDILFYILNRKIKNLILMKNKYNELKNLYLISNYKYIYGFYFIEGFLKILKLKTKHYLKLTNDKINKKVSISLSYNNITKIFTHQNLKIDQVVKKNKIYSIVSNHYYTLNKLHYRGNNLTINLKNSLNFNFIMLKDNILNYCDKIFFIKIIYKKYLIICNQNGVSYFYYFKIKFYLLSNILYMQKKYKIKLDFNLTIDYRVTKIFNFILIFNDKTFEFYYLNLKKTNKLDKNKLNLINFIRYDSYDNCKYEILQITCYSKEDYSNFYYYQIYISDNKLMFKVTKKAIINVLAIEKIIISPFITNRFFIMLSSKKEDKYKYYYLKNNKRYILSTMKSHINEFCIFSKDIYLLFKNYKDNKVELYIKYLYYEINYTSFLYDFEELVEFKCLSKNEIFIIYYKIKNENKYSLSVFKNSVQSFDRLLKKIILNSDNYKFYLKKINVNLVNLLVYNDKNIYNYIFLSQGTWIYTKPKLNFENKLVINDKYYDKINFKFLDLDKNNINVVWNNFRFINNNNTTIDLEKKNILKIDGPFLFFLNKNLSKDYIIYPRIIKTNEYIIKNDKFNLTNSTKVKFQKLNSDEILIFLENKINFKFNKISKTYDYFNIYNKHPKYCYNFTEDIIYCRTYEKNIIINQKEKIAIKININFKISFRNIKFIKDINNNIIYVYCLNMSSKKSIFKFKVVKVKNKYNFKIYYANLYNNINLINNFKTRNEINDFYLVNINKFKGIVIFEQFGSRIVYLKKIKYSNNYEYILSNKIDEQYFKYLNCLNFVVINDSKISANCILITNMYNLEININIINNKQIDLIVLKKFNTVNIDSSIYRGISLNLINFKNYFVIYTKTGTASFHTFIYKKSNDSLFLALKTEKFKIHDKYFYEKEGDLYISTIKNLNKSILIEEFKVINFSVKNNNLNNYKLPLKLEFYGIENKINSEAYIENINELKINHINIFYTIFLTMIIISNLINFFYK